jgi:YesN/AraC family two-component response regulator
MHKEDSSILIVDDEVPYTILLRQTLLLEGYENIHIANSGHDAVKLAVKHDFDLAIVDIKMRGIDGIETMYRLKDKRPGLNFVVVSGSAMSEAEYHKHADAIGVVASFSKPFDYNDFLFKLDSIIAEKPEYRERITA